MYVVSLWFRNKADSAALPSIVPYPLCPVHVFCQPSSLYRHNENDEAHKEQDVGQPLGYTLHVMCAYRWKPYSSYNLFHVNTFRNFLETPDSLSEKEDFHFRGMKWRLSYYSCKYGQSHNSHFPAAHRLRLSWMKLNSPLLYEFKWYLKGCFKRKKIPFPMLLP